MSAEDPTETPAFQRRRAAAFEEAVIHPQTNPALAVRRARMARDAHAEAKRLEEHDD
jgi:hypothetical protein